MFAQINQDNTKPLDSTTPEGQYHLGKLYAEGPVDRRDVDAAIKCYQEAAKGGYAKALLALGKLYFLENVRHNPRLAIDYLQ